MSRYLLDSTVLIQQWKKRPVIERWIADRLGGRDLVATTVVNISEVFARAHPSQRPYWEALFALLPIYSIGQREAVAAGVLQYELARRGLTLHTPDALIAAVAAAQGMTLVTANVKDFQNAGIDLLALDGDA